MSDATLKHARMSDELERALIQEAIQAQALSDGPFGRQAWRRLKLRMAASAAPWARCCMTWMPDAGTIR